jgi:hypothetical protein
MALLEAAAIAGNIDQFNDIYQGIDLHGRPESDMVCIVHLALGIGAMTAARETCAYGLTHFPANGELIKMQTIFTPPRITVNRQPSPAGTRANTEWLATHGDEYRGKWVALQAGVLVASGNSVDEILQVTGDVRGTNIFITPVH